MREIKFRAWDTNEKKMYYLRDNTPNEYGHYPYLEMQFYSDGDIMWSLGYASHGHVVEGVEDESGILMQFTGLYDKHNIEIYEGDIVSMHSKILHVDDIRNIKYWEEEYVNFSSSEMEVIGNVYQNPELLEEKEE